MFLFTRVSCVTLFHLSFFWRRHVSFFWSTSFSSFLMWGWGHLWKWTLFNHFICENIFSLPSPLNDSLSGYIILDWLFFFFFFCSAVLWYLMLLMRFFLIVFALWAVSTLPLAAMSLFLLILNTLLFSLESSEWAHLYLSYSPQDVKFLIKDPISFFKNKLEQMERHFLFLYRMTQCHEDVNPS